MRFRHSVVGFLVVLSFGLSGSAWSQLTYTVPVVDKSDPGNPLEISGTASFTELIVSNSVRSSSSFRVDARNLSEKGILLLRAYFDEAGPHGGGTRQVIQIDHFFWGYIAPGDSLVLARKRPGGRTSACCVTPLVPANQPKAEVRVQYVQFTDGSTFGDETSAKDILSTRSAILDALWRLDNARNRESFLELLAHKIQPDNADSFLETFRHTQRHHGTAAARSQVHTGVAAARAHAAALRAVQAER
jgi:hypothetical protein